MNESSLNAQQQMRKEGRERYLTEPEECPPSPTTRSAEQRGERSRRTQKGARLWVCGFLLRLISVREKAKGVDSTGVLVVVVGGISFFVFSLSFFLIISGLGFFWGVEKKRKVGRQ